MMGKMGTPNLPPSSWRRTRATFSASSAGHIAVVEGRVAPGKKDPLARQISSFQIFLHYAIALVEVLYILYQGDDTDVLGKELAYPVFHDLAVEEGREFPDQR